MFPSSGYTRNKGIKDNVITWSYVT